MIEPLESRVQFSSNLSADGVLTITGSVGPDQLSVYGIKDSYAVFENGQVSAVYKKKAVLRIVMQGLQGNDIITCGAKVPCVIDGGEGNDTIRGTDQADTLNGGPGNDSISGRGGNDVLDGGIGRDSLYGGNGDDFLILGPTRSFSDGGKGTNTLAVDPATTPGTRRNIQSVVAAGVRPTTLATELAVSTLSPAVSFTRNAKGNVVATITLALPAKATAVFGDKPRAAQAQVSLAVTVLSDPASTAAGGTITRSVDLGRLSATRFFALATSEGFLVRTQVGDPAPGA